jgi:hypothetical protein
MNIVEDTRINNIADQIIEYGSDIIRRKYLDMNRVTIETQKITEADLLDSIEQSAKSMKVAAIN